MGFIPQMHPRHFSCLVPRKTGQEGARDCNSRGTDKDTLQKTCQTAILPTQRPKALMQEEKTA